MIIVTNDREGHLKIYRHNPVPISHSATSVQTHTNHFLLFPPLFQYLSDVSVCHQWGALSHNDRPLWKALLPDLLVCHGLALPEMDVPLIELLHSNCFHLLIHKHFKPPSSPLNHNPISPHLAQDQAPILFITKIFATF